MRTIFLLPFFLFLACKSIDHQEAAQLELEKCIQLNAVIHLDSLDTCFKGIKYNLKGYILKDSIIYITDFKTQARLLDTVPANVERAFIISEGKSCKVNNIQKFCEVRTDIDFKYERRFWVKEDKDSIYTILKVY